ncbi:MAG: UV damage repair protein UvrX [Psychrobacillus sp.]
MLDYSKIPKRIIACIDMVSFYASCIAVLHDLDVRKVPIAVVGNLQQKGSVVLAASPVAKKKFNVRTGTRLYEIPNHPDIQLFEPKMKYFIQMSMAVTQILHKYAPPESIKVYSVDEIFIDLTGSERLFGDPEITIKNIQKEIFDTLQLQSSAGMGENILMSKLALDLEGKKSGFARWYYEDIPTKLWPVAPLSEMWGIGANMERNLNRMGIYKVGDIANFPLKMLEESFGVMGNQLYYHSYGLDYSTIHAPAEDKQISYGKSQMLMRDYSIEEIQVVILEMCEDVAKRSRDAFQAGRTITLGIGYSRNAFGGGFHRSRTIEEATNDTLTIYKVCLELLKEHSQPKPVRHVSISITKLEDEHSMQLSFFEENKVKKRKLSEAMDHIRNKYGSTALLRAVSYTEAGTSVNRAKLVGGHKG